MYEELKNADLKTLQIEQLVALAAFAVIYRQAAVDADVEVPWVERRQEAIRRAIRLKRVEGLEEEYAKVKKEEAALRTNEEKRGTLRERMNVLDRLLHAERGGQ